MKYKVNWINTPKGNGIKAGKTLIVKVSDTKLISGWVAKKKWYGSKKLQIGQGTNELKFKLLPIKKYEKGKYVLRVIAHDKTWQYKKWRDVFEVV